MALRVCIKHSRFPLTYLVYSLKISVFLVTLELLLEKPALMENRKCRDMDVLVTGAEITYFETDCVHFFHVVNNTLLFPFKRDINSKKDKGS